MKGGNYLADTVQVALTRGAQSTPIKAQCTCCKQHKIIIFKGQCRTKSHATAMTSKINFEAEASQGLTKADTLHWWHKLLVQVIRLGGEALHH